MRFIHHNLGHRKQGEIVEVTLTYGANVRLMNSANFSSYNNGRRYQYIGGLAKHSPLRLQIPNSGHWHIAIDMQGLIGNTKASVRFIPGALAEIQETPLSSASSLNQEDSSSELVGTEKGQDVFIFHAPEDKDDVVRPLYNVLTSTGLGVYCNEFTLCVEDSLRPEIDEGLAKSRITLGVLSPSFVGKGRANHELDEIVKKVVQGGQIFLPIWHNITKQQVVDFSPSMADKVARSTATHTVGEIAKEIAELLKVA